MYKPRQLGRTEIAALVLSSLKDVLSQNDDLTLGLMGESTDLIGPGSLDSLGLVTLIVDLEQRFKDEYGVSLTLADDRALSQKNSPFRTLQSLTDYICLLIEEKDGNAVLFNG
jgi:acyl carrier protein